jgi:hypothetical protein
MLAIMAFLLAILFSVDTLFGWSMAGWLMAGWLMAQILSGQIFG